MKPISVSEEEKILARALEIRNKDFGNQKKEEVCRFPPKAHLLHLLFYKIKCVKSFHFRETNI